MVVILVLGMPKYSYTLCGNTLNEQTLFLGGSKTYMLLTSPIILSLVSGTLVSFLVTYLAMKWRVLDHPNDRSSHTVSTPKAGGLGVMAGAMMPLAFATSTGAFGVPSAQLIAFILFGLLAGLLGFYDDLRDLSARLKFFTLAVLAFGVAVYVYPVSHFTLDQGQITLPLFFAFLGTALWVFVLGNAANFMDGSDSLVAIGGVITAATLALLSLDAGNHVAALMALALVVALLGFLPLNIPPARVFLGDTGALFIGFWLGGITLLYIHDGPKSAVYAAVLVFMPWLSDILLTMAWRAYHRMDLLSAHKDHVYQLMLRRGAGHGAVAGFLALQTLVCGALAWVFRASATSELLALGSIATLAVIGHWWARKIFTAPPNGATEL